MKPLAFSRWLFAPKWFNNADFGYWKVTVERPLRLKSQLKRSAIETLRFASGDEALRSEIFGRWGDVLYEQFAKLRPEIEAWLKGDDSDEYADDGEEDSKPTMKSIPENRRKKLLDPSIWLRDKALVELARLAQQELGEGVFDDHKVNYAIPNRYR